MDPTDPAPEAPPAPPLLPPLFLKPAAALWLWALPALLLLLLNLQAYWLIEGNMDTAQRAHAYLLGLAGAGNLLAALLFFAFTKFRPQRAESGYAGHLLRGVSIVGVQAAYLWLATAWIDEVLPRSVTTWIYPDERFLFNQYAFTMLPLFLGILRIACGRPAAHAGKAIALNLVMAISAPVLLFLISHLFFGFFGWHAREIVLTTSLVVLGVTMFIGLFRATMLLLRRASGWGPTGERIAIVFSALVLPICGLLLNRDIPFPVDLQAWEVYALVVANTAILLLASWQHAHRPRLSFLLLCASFPFSLYFFFVFLPYTPLSILAIIVFGAGFLVLAPTFLFLLHLHLLNKARQAIAAAARPARVWIAGILCTLLLPGFFVARGLADRAALHSALDYVYAPVIESTDLHYSGTLGNLRRALASHRSYKNGIYYPLLSDFYAWLVFDNLVLPDDKLATLETTFFGAAGSNKSNDPFRHRPDFWGKRSNRDRHRAPRAAEMLHAVRVSRLDLQTTPAAGPATTVTLALTLVHNAAANNQPAEYVQALPLPAGVFVNGFRLHINGTPVPGRIVEKKTALWVYNMIRDTERRDPGLLVYTAPGELELRVFPITPGTPVTVEIDFLVPAHLAEHDLGPPSTAPNAVLGTIGERLQPQLARSERGTVVTGLDALHLPAVDREPYIHFIVDRSADNAFTGDFATAVRTVRKRFPRASHARVTLANFAVADLTTNLTPLDQLAPLGAPDWESEMPAAGGLSLDVTLARALRHHREDDLDQKSNTVPLRPLFVILSRTAKTRTLALSLTEAWSEAGEELELRELGADGTDLVHRENVLDSVPLVRCGDSVRPLVANRAVRFAATAPHQSLEFYDSPSATWLPVVEKITPMAQGKWTEAVALHLRQQDHARSPGSADDDLPALVAASRASGILIPATSYIVVENSAQWRMLELGEKQKLGQNAALEFVETPAPPALLIAISFGAWVAFRRRRRD